MCLQNPLGSWKEMPVVSLTSSGSFTMSCPITVAVPRVGFSTVASRWSRVVLPEPLGPSSTRISPRLTPRSRLSSAVVLP